MTPRRLRRTSPIRTKAALKRAASEAIRTSAASASPNPAPAAAPLTAAITGVGIRRRAAIAPAHCSWPANISGTDHLTQPRRVVEIEAGAEPTPRAGDDQRADRLVGADLLGERAQLGERRRR